MDPVHAIFDPEGDVTLILRNPDAPFAVWDECLDYDDTIIRQRDSKQLSRKALRKFLSLDEGRDSSSLPAPGHAPVEFGRGIAANDAAMDDEAGAAELHMQLSSKHLTLASTYFRKMIQGDWKESQASSSKYSLSACDWGTNATVILMNIIHGRVRSVPRSVSIETLAEIAVMVDYYDCHEVVEMFSDCWIQELSPKLPTTYGRDLMLWLAISRVFSERDIFATVINIAARESTGPMQTMGLPIPQGITEHIDQRRRDYIDQVISGLHYLLQYLNTRKKCSFECSSILVGALSRQMAEQRLLDPRPTKPFLGRSIAETTLILHSIEILRWRSKGNNCRCSFGMFFGSGAGSLADGPEGLEIDDFWVVPKPPSLPRQL